MGDTIGAVAVTEYKSMAKRQLPTYRIDTQIDPWTFTDFHVCIVSNLGAETADRDELIHDIFPEALSLILDKRLTYRPLKGRNHANPLTRPLFSSDESPALCTNAILNNHEIDNFATGDTAPPTNTVMLPATRPNEQIYRTHKAIATMTRHSIIASIKTGTVQSRGMPSVTQRSRLLYCLPYEAAYAIAVLSSD